MPRLRFTENLQRHVRCPDADARGDTVRGVLDDYFRAHPDVRGFVLDDQGRLRKHMAVFVNGRPVADRVGLTDPVRDGEPVDVMQALSGG